MTIDVLLGDGPHGSLSLSTSLNCVVKEAGGDSDGGESEMDTKQQHKSPWSRCFLFSNTFQSFNLVLFRVFFFQMDPKWYIFTEIIIFETRKYFVKYDENISLYTFW